MLLHRLVSGGSAGRQAVREQARTFAYRYRKVFALVGAGSTAYLGYNLNQVPVTGRWRVQAFSIAREVELSKSLQAEEISPALVLRESAPVSLAARRILDLLIHTAERELLPKQDQGQIPWRVRIVSSPTVNAYCGPGGNIVVYTGLIDFCAKAEALGLVDNSAAALSGVLAHELSHGIARHSMELLSWLPFLTGAGVILELFLLSLGLPGTEVIFVRDLFNSLAQIVVNLPHSRGLESEADLLACEILVAAGFPTADFPKMLGLLADAGSVMGKAEGKAVRLPEVLSTHPDSARRQQETSTYLRSRHANASVDHRVRQFLLQASQVFAR